MFDNESDNVTLTHRETGVTAEHFQIPQHSAGLLHLWAETEKILPNSSPNKKNPNSKLDVKLKTDFLLRSYCYVIKSKFGILGA